MNGNAQAWATSADRDQTGWPVRPRPCGVSTIQGFTPSNSAEIGVALREQMPRRERRCDGVHVLVLETTRRRWSSRRSPANEEQQAPSAVRSVGLDWVVTVTCGASVRSTIRLIRFEAATIGHMAPVPDIRRSRRALIFVGLVGLAMGLVYASAELAPVAWDPPGVIGVGEDDAVRIEYAESVFGREIPLPETVGHDGRFFFIQAMDPCCYILRTTPHSSIDRPIGRSGCSIPRWPVLPGPFGPDAVAWAMIASTWLRSQWARSAPPGSHRRLASHRGGGSRSPSIQGVRFELDIAGAGVVAFAAVVWGLVFLREGRVRSGCWHVLLWRSSPVR